ncbi:bifunctional chitinase/lysozyme [Spiroplasma chinense]|uniref:Bifunctional chitinase/lysozyme n=1 Tax=Spiroplasma chinense TaxID=216932 RepID=A0A5B9Y3J2_9MOLU|nr:hypothetical protein [Spiroplasma chinense]QEH61624.1 bifunctional chitinase/lysozyme [Spiroplasma chinense]
MKKLLNLLAITTIVSSASSAVVACGAGIKDPYNLLGDDENTYKTGDEWTGDSSANSELGAIKSNSIKNQDWQEVLSTNYSNTSRSVRSESDIWNTSTLADKDLLTNKLSNELEFTPYADMGIVEDTAEYLMKERGKSSGVRAEAEASIIKHGAENIVYNDLGEISGNKEVITDASEITLGFMQNASDTGELVPMWNAAPAVDKVTGVMGKGILDEEGKETEYAKWFNDRYRNWTGKDKTNTRWVGNDKTGNLDSKKLRISFGPFANSLWHTAWKNNKTPLELAETIKAIGERYETKKFDFYFAAPYLSKNGDYADSQRLLASALKILLEQDNEFDIQLSLVMSTADGISISDGFLGNYSPHTKGDLYLLGDEAFPLYNFTKYLGMNFRLNLVAGYTDVWSQDQSDSEWELKLIQSGVEKSHENWRKMYDVIFGKQTSLNANQTKKRVKITSWIGRRAEVAAWNFSPKEAVKLRSWAAEQGLGGVGMFYISRDVPSLFIDNGGTSSGQADLNALNQNVRSGSGFEQFTYAKALNGTITSETPIPDEAITKEDVKKIGGIDYFDVIDSNEDLDDLEVDENWDGPGFEGPGGAGQTEGGKPQEGKGTSLYTTWAEANPNRKTNIDKKSKANGSTYYSPYVDAGLYSGNDIAGVKQNVNNFDSITLAFVQQVNSHGDYLDLSIAGQPSSGEGYSWWEKSQLWDKMLKPLATANKLQNVKVAYGGATTGGNTFKNPWTLENSYSKTEAQKIQDLRKAFEDYQNSLVKLANDNGVSNVKMPKSIDFDIEGHAQNLNEDNRLLAKTLATMKKADKTWDFSITLPVLPTGLTSVGYNVMNIFVEEFKKAGLGQKDLPVINLMLMDYGDPIYIQARDQEKITNFELARRAMNATKNNLATSIEKNYGSVSVGNSGLYKLLGATPMIGVNDTVHGVFTLEDAKDLYNWSQLVGLSYIGIWSMNDDRGKEGNKLVSKSLTSHGLAYLDEYDFSRAFSGDWTKSVIKPKEKA